MFCCDNGCGKTYKYKHTALHHTRFQCSRLPSPEICDGRRSSENPVPLTEPLGEGGGAAVEEEEEGGEEHGQSPEGTVAREELEESKVRGRIVVVLWKGQ